MTGADRFHCGVPDISYHSENAWKIDDKQKEPYIGIYYHCEDGTDYFVAYNMQEREQEIAIPPLGKNKEWNPVFTTSDSQTDAEGVSGIMMEKNQRTVVVAARTIVLFIGR